MDPILKNQTMIKFNMMMILIKRVTPVTRRVPSQVQFHIIIFYQKYQDRGKLNFPEKYTLSIYIVLLKIKTIGLSYRRLRQLG